jgi:hypothetical protein
MPLTQQERGAAGAVEGMPREENSVEAEESGVDEEAEVTKEGVDPHMTPKENRNSSPKEELA